MNDIASNNDHNAEDVDSWLSEGTTACTTPADGLGDTPVAVNDERFAEKQREKIAELCATLNEGQRAAIEGIGKLKTGLVIVEGHAGTGKTYVLKVILESFWDKPRACLAPTHQALSQITGLHEDKSIFSTVASFFKVRKKIDNQSGEEVFTDPQFSDPKHLYGGMVACDEGSMLGENEANLLLRLAQDMLVIILRDNAQLPPVNKAKSNIDSAATAIYTLTEQMRNGDMVLALCSHFRTKTTIPRSSRGNVVIHNNRREMLSEFMADIKANPIPGEAVYLAFTNKQMTSVRDAIGRHLYGNEDYPPGQWLRLELCEEMSRQMTANGKEQILMNRRSLTGKVVESFPHTACIAGETYEGFKLRLVDEHGVVLKHKPPVSDIGRLVIPQEEDLFFTLSFPDLDHLSERLKKIFLNNRSVYRKLKEGKISHIERADLQAQHERGIQYAQEAQRLCVALSPYAYTVHKSQGMTIRRVFVDAANILQHSHLPKHPTKELLYVASSRTKDTLHILT